MVSEKCTLFIYDKQDTFYPSAKKKKKLSARDEVYYPD